MSIIKTHQITLHGGLSGNIVLRPLSDDHLPYLYKWCADPEVLYWTEGGPADRELSYGPETVHQIYGTVSQNAFCFLIEVDGVPIGECWLQKMNLPDVRAMYPEGTDVRRIDISIGEKTYWNRGIGTACVKMLIDLAFSRENVDVLHCICEDYNVRSVRMWEKLGFSRVLAEPLPEHYKGQWQCHYRLTREEFIQRRANEAGQLAAVEVRLLPDSTRAETKIIVRPLVTGDIEAFMAWRATDDYLANWVRKEIGEHLDGKRILLVAEADGQLVGTVQFVPDHEDKELADGRLTAYLQALEIREDFRRRGLGTWLITSVERLAVERGFRRLTLMVEPDNGPALSLYRKLGFSFFKDFTEIRRGKPHYLLCMEKQLSGA